MSLEPVSEYFLTTLESIGRSKGEREQLMDRKQRLSELYLTSLSQD
jgi:hypothetical protein